MALILSHARSDQRLLGFHRVLSHYTQSHSITSDRGSVLPRGFAKCSLYLPFCLLCIVATDSRSTQYWVLPGCLNKQHPPPLSLFRLSARPAGLYLPFGLSRFSLFPFWIIRGLEHCSNGPGHYVDQRGTRFSVSRRTVRPEATSVLHLNTMWYGGHCHCAYPTREQGCEQLRKIFLLRILLYRTYEQYFGTVVGIHELLVVFYSFLM